jgi:predicted RecA/RadA family phage recombinase
MTASRKKKPSGSPISPSTRKKGGAMKPQHGETAMRNKIATAMVILALVAVSAYAVIQLVNPYPAGGTAGDRLQRDGIVIRVKESNITHVDSSSGSDTFVNKGDACLVGASGGIIGVAASDAASASDYVSVEEDGVFYFSISPATSIAYGGTVYIVNATGVISESSSSATKFGFSLNEDTVSTPSTAVIAVRLTKP